MPSRTYKICLILLLLFWVGSHLSFCLKVGNSESPGKIHIALLFGINILLLVHAFFFRGKPDPHLVHFVMGITPLGLTGLAMASALPLLGQFLKGPDTTVDIPACTSYAEERLTERRLLLALDVSQTMLRAELNDPSQAPRTGVDQVCDLIEEIFDSEVGRAELFSRRGEILPFKFSDVVRVSEGHSRRVMSRGLWSSNLCDSLREDATRTKEGLKTDFVELLIRMRSEIEDILESNDNAYVTLLIVSDFFHEATGVNGRSEGLEAISEDLQRLAAQSLNNSGRARFHVAALRANRPLPDNLHVDAYSKIGGLLGPAIWRGLSVSHLVHSENSREKREVMISSLISPLGFFDHTDRNCRLSIGHSPEIDPESEENFISGVVLPKMKDGERYELMGLRLGEATSLTGYDLSLQFRQEQDGRPLFALTSGLFSDWQVATGRQDQFVVGTDGIVHDSEVARTALQISLPEDGVIYDIPVVLGPVAGEDFRWAYYALVAFFALSVVLLALRVWIGEFGWPDWWNKIRGRAGIALLLLGITLSLAGCAPHPEPPEAPSAETVLSEFDALHKIQAEDKDGQKLQLYLDASGSMAGFLGISQSNFYRTLDRLFDRAVSGGYDIEIFKFDGEVGQLPSGTSTTQLNSRNYFSSGETSFPTLFRSIDKTRPDSGIALIVTDLVQSSQTGEQRELSRTFREFAQDRPEVLVIALKSSFVGTYWPESTPANDRIRLDLRGNDHRSTRPFYLVAIADNSRDLELLQRRLGLNVENGSLSWSLDASEPAAVVKYARFAPSIDHGDEWQLAKSTAELDPDGRTHRSVIWLRERSIPAADAAIQVDYETEGRIAIESMARVVVDARRCSFSLSGPCEVPERVRVSAEVQQIDAGGNLRAYFQLPRPAEGTWDAYQLRLLPGEANLDPPRQADLWTTNNDARVANGNRTYKLDLFVDTLTTSLREPVPFVEQYIVLGREN